MIESFDLDAVIRFAPARGPVLSIARIGFFLEQHRDALMFEDAHPRRLRAKAPAQPRYFDAKRRSGRLVAGWSPVVPDDVLQRRWDEVE